LFVFEEFDAATDLETLASRDDDQESTTTKRNSKLDLVGVLDSLDGWADNHNRIIFITSNHFDKLAALDGAFTRPGRIDMHIDMHTLTISKAIDMLAYAFEEKLTSDQQTRVCEIFKAHPDEITAALLENIIHHASIKKGLDNAIDVLERSTLKKDEHGQFIIQ
jgi:ATP-dependent 26S proteasome regulatory subunit